MMNEQDQALIARIAEGDQSAVRLLYGQHSARVFRFILRTVSNEATAEELTNEVFLDVWRHAASYRGQAAVTTWLLSIARNKAISRLRKRSDAPLDEEFAETIADDTDLADTGLAKQGKAGLMRICIDKLSPAHREIIDLVYYHERSVSEAAEILGIPENTVKTRMFHARKQLTEHFRRAGIDRGWP
jgi:RNA polymerase sigma-70 factor (ECF subfamily)